MGAMGILIYNHYIFRAQFIGALMAIREIVAPGSGGRLEAFEGVAVRELSRW